MSVIRDTTIYMQVYGTSAYRDALGEALSKPATSTSRVLLAYPAGWRGPLEKYIRKIGKEGVCNPFKESWSVDQLYWGKEEADQRLEWLCGWLGPLPGENKRISEARNQAVTQGKSPDAYAACDFFILEYAPFGDPAQRILDNWHLEGILEYLLGQASSGGEVRLIIPTADILRPSPWLLTDNSDQRIAAATTNNTGVTLRISAFFGGLDGVEKVYPDPWASLILSSVTVVP